MKKYFRKVNEIILGFLEINSKKEMKILGKYNLNDLILMEDTIKTWDYFYDIKIFNHSRDLSQKELNENINIFLTFSHDRNKISCLKMKNISIPSDFSFAEITNLKDKKYFHRIEDVFYFKNPQNLFIRLNLLTKQDFTKRLQKVLLYMSLF